MIQPLCNVRLTWPRWRHKNSEENKLTLKAALKYLALDVWCVPLLLSASTFNHNKDSNGAESFLSLCDCWAPTAPSAICDFGQTVPVAWRNHADHILSTAALTLPAVIRQSSPASSGLRSFLPPKCWGGEDRACLLVLTEERCWDERGSQFTVASAPSDAIIQLQPAGQYSNPSFSILWKGPGSLDSPAPIIRN